MVSNKPLRKSVFFLMLIFIIGASCGPVRNLLWDDPYCNTFSPDGKCCIKCSYHYWMDKNGRCQPVSDWCKTWQESTGCCTSCFPGYGNPVNGVCASTPVVGTPTNVQNNCSDNCKCYGYVDENKKFYKTSIQGCKKVCIECNDGHYLNYVYQCISLPKNCKDADMYGNCTQCIDGFHADEKGCCVPDCEDKCAEYGYIDIAKKWLPNLTTGCRKVCKCCKPGFYLNYNFQCVALPKYCKAADAYGKCTDCVSSYKVDDGVCVTCDDHCAEYGYVDSQKRWFSIWNNGCKKVCKCCKTGYYLSDDFVCLELPAYCLEANCTGACTSCDEGYHVESGLCIKDDDHCAEYGYLDSSKKWLPTWIIGCKKVCKCCDKGFYLNCDNICVALPSKCTAANFSGACTSCVQGYHVETGICVKDDDHCAEYGYLDSEKKWWSTWVKGCKKVCKCCDKGFYLNCDNICVVLPSNCTAANQSGECTSCVSGYHVEKGFCVQDDDHCAEYGYLDGARKWWPNWVNGCKKVCKCCDKGFYLNCDNVCLALPTGCLQAQPNGTCTKCCDEYILKTGVCTLKQEESSSTCDSHGSSKDLKSQKSQKSKKGGLKLGHSKKENKTKGKN